MRYYLLSSELQHHGILGMKWGIRRYQPYPDGKTGKYLAVKQAKKAKTSNVEKWGKDVEHNTLYITGKSGSGKSTLAKDLASKGNAEVIHLDSYLEIGDVYNNKNDAFNDFLSKRVPNYELLNKKDGFSDRKERWKILDAVGDQIEPFSKELYKNGKKLIVEGLQLSDDTIFPNKDYFKDKPIAILTTNDIKSMYQAITRDIRLDVTNANSTSDKLSIVVKNLKDLPVSLKERADWYNFFDEKLDYLSKTVDAKTGQEFLEKYLKGG